ncbi:MAG: hypothetical protein LIQ30_07855 [Planctomycetes bacterium]|nr:hypothetical protein [Planctomycetota bacterium]
MAKAIVPAKSHAGSTGTEDKVFEYGYYDTISTGKGGVEVSTADIHAATRAASAIGNPNILINTDFRNIINQRGYGGEEVGAGVFTYDRWNTWSGKQIHSMVDGAFRMLSPYDVPSGYVSVMQNIESRGLVGREITFSCKVRLSGLGGMIVLTDGSQYSQHPLKNPGVWEEVKLTRVVTSGIRLAFRIGQIAAVRAGDYLEFKDVKIEEGNVVTPWRAPGYRDEFDRCRRFFMAYTTGNWDRTIIGSGVAATTTRADILITIPIMRATPAFSSIGNFTAGTTVTSFNFISASSGAGKIQVNANVTGPLTVNTPVFLYGRKNSSLMLDAEMPL